MTSVMIVSRLLAPLSTELIATQKLFNIRLNFNDIFIIERLEAVVKSSFAVRKLDGIAIFLDFCSCYATKLLIVGGVVTSAYRALLLDFNSIDISILKNCIDIRK